MQDNDLSSKFPINTAKFVGNLKPLQHQELQPPNDQLHPSHQVRILSFVSVGKIEATEIVPEIFSKKSIGGNLI